MFQLYFLQMIHTSILYSDTSLKKLNETIQIAMDQITNWLNVNKLSVNTTETKFILFRSTNKKQSQNISITMNNENLKQVKNTIFLGIVIDECLTWNDHLNLISKKMIISLAIID